MDSTDIEATAGSISCTRFEIDGRDARDPTGWEGDVCRAAEVCDWAMYGVSGMPAGIWGSGFSAGSPEKVDN
jgi:hypothetical protein